MRGKPQEWQQNNKNNDDDTLYIEIIYIWKFCEEYFSLILHVIIYIAANLSLNNKNYNYSSKNNDDAILLAACLKKLFPYENS